MSNRYNQNSYSVIAGVSVNESNKNHIFEKAIVITDPIRKELIKNYSVHKIHASIINLLIKDTQRIKKIIICSDVNPVDKVMSLVNELLPGMFGRIKSIEDLREEIGDKTFQSKADGFARNVNRNFPKRLNKHRRKNYFDNESVIVIDNEKSNDYKLILKFLNTLKKKEK